MSRPQAATPDELDASPRVAAPEPRSAPAPLGAAKYGHIPLIEKPARPKAILAVLSLAAFMASLDLFIVNVAFDDIGRDFPSASLSDLSWVLSSYAIAYAALLVPLGRLADRYGRKSGFLLGLSIFVAASAACAASTSLWALVAFRAVKAAGAALLTPTSLALLLEATPAPDRSRAVRIWAVTGSLAAAAGPVLGGLLVAVSWRWVFLVNVPIGLAAIVGAHLLVPRSRASASGPIPDLLGAALLALTVGSLAYALVEAPELGWVHRNVGLSLGAAAVGAVSFVWRSRRHPSPVVEASLLRVGSFAWANAAALLFNLAFSANLLAVILWMQHAWRLAGTGTGFAITPGPLMVPLFAAVAQKAFKRGVPPGRVAALGSLLCATGALLMSRSVGPTPSYALEVLPGWLIGGAGVGFAMPTILSSATVDLPRDRSATGSAIVNMSRQIGAVLGVSVLVAILGKPSGFEQTLAAFRHVWLAVVAVGVLAALASLRMRPLAAAAPAPSK